MMRRPKAAGIQGGSVGKSKYIAWLRERAGANAWRIALLAVISGALQAVLVVIINAAIGNISKDTLNFRYFVMFVVCMGGYLYYFRQAVTGTMKLAAEIVYDTQERLVGKLARIDYQAFERSDKNLMYKNLVESTDILFESARSLVNAISGMAMVVGSSLYIGFLSPMALIAVAVLVFLGVAVYLATEKEMTAHLRISKGHEKNFLGYFKQLIGGFAELKMSSQRSADLLDNHLWVCSGQARESRIVAERFITSNMLSVQSFYFCLIAGIIFVLPQISQGDVGLVGKIAAAALFLMGPMSSVIMAAPMLAKSDYALGAIQDLEVFLDQADEAKETDPDSPLAGRLDFQDLLLKGATFQYQDGKEGQAFKLGPVDLEVKANEILFLVGGNGTGKSTLMKVLAGLYRPQSGQIILDGIRLDASNYAHYRDRICLILSGFHLFDRLYGAGTMDVQRLEELLVMMKLSGATKFKDGAFTTLELSSGQRRRLALVLAMMEDKPIMLFDEVAADLDPSFREFFYTQLLPMMKNNGKTVIAVSHDDRYFHVADRVVKLDYGQVAGN
jgi:putative ATP-binding cassette transporter